VSLTSELRSGRPARICLDRRLGTRFGEVRLALPSEKRARLRQIAAPPPPDLSRGQRATIGTAFDYRARYYFEIHPVQPWAAHWGAMLFCSECSARLADGTVRPLGPTPQLIRNARRPDLRDLVDQYFLSLDSLVSRLNPVGRAIDEHGEEKLARTCLVLALFEQIFRANHLPDFDSPLFALPHEAVLEDLISIPLPSQVADVCALSRAFHEDEEDSFNRPSICGPTFSGSSLAGGADADLLVEDMLLELKARANVNLADWLRQLVGYVLLDFEDEFKIRRVAVYAARQRVHVDLDLAELVGDPARDGLQVSFEDRLRSMRDEFNSVLKTGRLPESFPFVIPGVVPAKARKPRQSPGGRGTEFLVLLDPDSLRDRLVEILTGLGGYASTHAIVFAASQAGSHLGRVSREQIAGCLCRYGDDFERVDQGGYRLRIARGTEEAAGRP
jgi:hypothetical protein